MIMVFSKCRCTELIRRLGRLVALPGHPSTEKSIDGSARGKATRYYIGGSGIRAGSIAAIAHPNRTCCIYIWVSREAVTRSAPQYVQMTKCLCQSWCESPLTVIWLPYAGVESLSTIITVWYTIVTVFSTLVRSPNRSNRPIIAPNNHWSLTGGGKYIIWVMKMTLYWEITRCHIYLSN